MAVCSTYKEMNGESSCEIVHEYYVSPPYDGLPGVLSVTYAVRKMGSSA
jgi:hypothetical protein